MKKVSPPLSSSLEDRGSVTLLRDDPSRADQSPHRDGPSPASGAVRLRVISSSDIAGPDGEEDGGEDIPTATDLSPGIGSEGFTRKTGNGSGRAHPPVALVPGPPRKREDTDVDSSPFSVSSLMETGRRLAGLSFLPGLGAPPSGGPQDLDLVKGVLWHACVVTVDELFEDLMSFTDDLSIQGRIQVDTLVLSELPPWCADKVNGFFTRKFLTALIDVTNHLTHEWRPLPTIAHALALRVLLNKAESLAEIFEVDMPAHWRTVLEDNLYGGLDLEPLYAPAPDAGADLPPAAGTMMDFATWFTPLSPGQHVTPFAAF